ncbi:MAG: DUF2384 domain-containing protein [Gemmatimonadales bacterium]|nr:DUF2384 domain-containing protein [Gemmatimonadales bacterium]
MSHPFRSAAPLPAPTLSKAVVRAASHLGLNQSELALTLGISRASASRLVAGRYQLSPTRGKEWELGALLVRLFRSLDALVGHGDAATIWLRGPNRDLNGTPIALIGTTEGLVRVIHYLDAVRGRV